MICKRHQDEPAHPYMALDPETDADCPDCVYEDVMEENKDLTRLRAELKQAQQELKFIAECAVSYLDSRSKAEQRLAAEAADAADASGTAREEQG